jgi:hypothetical protein
MVWVVWVECWAVGSKLSMAARAEITKKYATGYARADKKTKGLILDQVMGVTGWSRDNARRRLSSARATGVRRQNPETKDPITRALGFEA